METITFKNNKLNVIFSYSKKPVFRISRVRFSLEGKEWVNHLYNVSLIIKFKALDADNKNIGDQQFHVSLGDYITIDQKQPVIEINKTLNFSFDPPFQTLISCNNWKIEITLSNSKLNKDEKLFLDYMDTTYIQKRVDDWQKRVHNLIETIKSWSKENKSLSVQPTRSQKMHEGLMKTFNVSMVEIDSVDIKLNNKTIIVLKHFGLWIMGANGRLDLLTAKGNFVLVDEAEKFHDPKWKLFLKNDKKKGIEFTKDSFNQLIGL